MPATVATYILRPRTRLTCGGVRMTLQRQPHNVSTCCDGKTTRGTEPVARGNSESATARSEQQRHSIGHIAYINPRTFRHIKSSPRLPLSVCTALPIAILPYNGSSPDVVALLLSSQNVSQLPKGPRMACPTTAMRHRRMLYFFH